VSPTEPENPRDQDEPAPIREARPPRRLTSLLFFALSLAIAIPAFGLVFDPLTVTCLIAVLLFHEGGHLLAMKLFGYRDTRILFIPFLGAVTMGRETDAGPGRKAVVYLAGPVPGLILGLVALLLDGWQTDTLLGRLGWLALLLNYLNLLPLMPFDGGQLVRVLFYDRYPRSEPLFLIVSGTVLLTIGAIVGDWLLIGLAVFLFIAVRGSWWEAAVLRRLRAREAELGSGPDPERRMGSILEALAGRPQRSRTREAGRLYRRLSARAAGPGLIAKVAAVYALAIVVPILVFAAAARDRAADRSGDAWQEAVMRFRAARDAEDPDVAREAAARLLATVEDLGRDDPRYWTAHAYGISRSGDAERLASLLTEAELAGFPRDRLTDILEGAAGAGGSGPGALLLMDAVVRIRTELLGDNHVRLATALIARAWYRAPTDPAAITDLERALVILTHHRPDPNGGRDELLMRLAVAECYQGRANEALALIEARLEQAPGALAEHEAGLRADQLTLVGWLRLAQGDRQGALAAVKHAHELRQSGAVPPRATSSIDVAIIAGLAGASAEARTWLERAGRHAQVASHGGPMRFLEAVSPWQEADPWSVDALLAERRREGLRQIMLAARATSE